MSMQDQDLPGRPVEPSRGSHSAAMQIVEWLVGDECHELDDAGLAAGLGRRLQTSGLPVDRLALHLRTLHPELSGRTVAWGADAPVEILDRDHGIDISATFVGSPQHHVMVTGKSLVVRRDAPTGPAWTQLDVFANRPFVELFVAPLSNGDGSVSAVSFCTTRPDGFADSEREALMRIVPALRNACELRTLRQTELALLDTYIGSTSASRVLSGRVRRGQVESMEAALLLCDLRGFTELSNRLPVDRVLELLDAYFDRVVPAIAAEGGEILKFMGDAVLAFFHRDGAAEACVAALRGALKALERLAEFRAGDAEILAGIALHYGKVSYGNIGSGKRLDFTVIGADVNLVSRIQTVCGKTGRELLMSRRFAKLLDAKDVVSMGSHELRGFAEREELYALAHQPRSRRGVRG